MDFGLTETQELLLRSAREFLSERCKPSHVRAMAQDERGYAPDFWRDVARLGWTGTLVPEQHGGAGLTFADMAPLLEEWGAHLAPGPLVESSVVSALVISQFGDRHQKEQFLSRIADGSRVVVPALLGREGDWANIGSGVTARRTGDVWTLTGESMSVHYAGPASDLLVLAREAGSGNCMVLLAEANATSHMTRTALKSSAGIHSCLVEFNEATARDEDAIGGPEGGGAIADLALRYGAAARALQMAGAARRVLDMTVKYVSGRKQFGRPLGSFQAIQHRLAEAATRLQGARHLAYQAAWSLAEGRPSAREVALAKLTASELLPQVCSLAHQCHGAIGFTWEHGLHLYTRHAIAWQPDYGGAAFHREALARTMGL